MNISEGLYWECYSCNLLSGYLLSKKKNSQNGFNLKNKVFYPLFLHFRILKKYFEFKFTKILARYDEEMYRENSYQNLKESVKLNLRYVNHPKKRSFEKKAFKVLEVHRPASTPRHKIRCISRNDSNFEKYV